MIRHILILAGVSILVILLITWLVQKVRKRCDGGFVPPIAVISPREIFKRSLKDKEQKIKRQVNSIPRKENRRKKG